MLWSLVKHPKSQSGFSLAEVVVGLAVIVTVFAASFKLLAQLRKSSKSESTSGPQMYFESFAVTRLKQYFSKLMQWSMHVNSDKSTNLSSYCSDVSSFAFAALKPSLGSDLANWTLGTDFKLALQTFPSGSSKAEQIERIRNYISKKKIGDTSAVDSSVPWGALIPVSNVADVPSTQEPAQVSFDWCNQSATSPKGNTLGKTMCDAFDKCVQRAGSSWTPSVQPRVNGYSNPQTDLRNVDSFTMCFVFKGNLFSSTDTSSTSLTGVKNIDQPVVAGLVIAKASFMDAETSEKIKCNPTTNEKNGRYVMNRVTRVSAEIYTATNVDKAASAQQYFKSVREFSSEKFGVKVANCNDPSRGGRLVQGGTEGCLQDPTWIYSCSSSCELRFN